MTLRAELSAKTPPASRISNAPAAMSHGFELGEEYNKSSLPAARYAISNVIAPSFLTLRGKRAIGGNLLSARFPKDTRISGSDLLDETRIF